MSGKTAPGPRGWPLSGHLYAFRRDVLGLLHGSRERCGDVVRFRLGPGVLHLVAHPREIRQVLVEREERYDKETRSAAKIRGLAGGGLLTTNGPRWKRQRRLIQPGFRPTAIAGFVPAIVAETDGMLAGWEEKARRGAPFDVASEMMRLTYAVAGRTLFGADLRQGSTEVEAAMEILLGHTYRRLERIVDLPLVLPTPANLRFRRALASVDRVVYGILAGRHRQIAAGFSPPPDLLTTLIAERDEGGKGMDDRELRDEAVTLLLAGHETTANALTWALYLLALHPEAEERLRAEVDAVLGAQAPAAEDLPRLELTHRVVREALRLYPPIWAMERHAREEDEIGGYRIPAHSTVVISPWVTHRHPDFWPDPERFDPDRFAPEREAERPALAWLPFGAGPRYCVGAPFATTEMLVVLARAAQRFRLRLVPGQAVEPLPGITLRARHGVRVTAELRA